MCDDHTHCFQANELLMYQTILVRDESTIQLTLNFKFLFDLQLNHRNEMIDVMSDKNICLLCYC